MDGLRDVMSVKMFALGMKQLHTTTLMKPLKRWIKSLNIDSLKWDDKTWEEKLKGTTLKR